MHGTIMISLVGEQRVPNLLPVLQEKPQRVVLVCTERTKAVSERLRSVLKDRDISVEDEPLRVDPYDMADIEIKLKAHIMKKAGLRIKSFLTLQEAQSRWPWQLTAWRNSS